MYIIISFDEDSKEVRVHSMTANLEGAKYIYTQAAKNQEGRNVELIELSEDFLMVEGCTLFWDYSKCKDGTMKVIWSTTREGESL